MSDVNGESSDRREYVRERKNFLNEKSYNIFEKYQIAILAYLGYALVILTGGLKGDYTIEAATNLVHLSHNVLAVLVIVFVIFMVINLLEWKKYEREENSLIGPSSDVVQSKWFLWIETWMIIIGVCEYLATRWLVQKALEII